MGLVSGDRVLLKNTHVTAPTTGPFGPEMYEITRTMGDLLLLRSGETGKAKTVRNENCKLRPHAIAVSYVDGGGGEGGRRRRATAPRNSRRNERRSSPERPKDASNSDGDSQRDDKTQKGPLDQGRQRWREKYTTDCKTSSKREDDKNAVSPPWLYEVRQASEPPHGVRRGRSRVPATYSGGVRRPSRRDGRARSVDPRGGRDDVCPERGRRPIIETPTVAERGSAPDCCGLSAQRSPALEGCQGQGVSRSK